MSESVRIGGIGKNPAIDRINSLNAADIKNQAVKRMEQLLLTDVPEIGKYTKIVPVDFSRVDWKGTSVSQQRKENQNRNGNDHNRRNWMAGISLSEWEAAYRVPEGLGKTGGGSAGGEIPVQYETAGNICGLPGGQDLHAQQAGKTAAGEAGISGSEGDTAGGQPHIPGEH